MGYLRQSVLVEMDIIGTYHQKALLKPDDHGSLSLPVDFEGDSIPVYRCRLTQRGTLACIFQGHGPGIGVEFKKMQLKS